MTVPSQVDAQTVNPPLSTPCEIRVHGIGDHREWSSLGSPRLLARNGSGDIMLAAPPNTPKHPLALFNWSRTTRRVARWLWYLAFPYTLMNVANEMAPDDDPWVVRVHAAFVQVASIALTMLTALWVMTGAEAAAVSLQWGGVLGGDPLQQSMLLGAGVLIAIPLIRVASGTETDRHAPFALLHAVVIALTAVGALLTRPAQIILDPDSFFIAHATYGPDSDGMRRVLDYFASQPEPSDTLRVEQLPHLDALGLITYITVFTVLALAAALTVVAAGRSKPTSRAPLVGTAVAAVLGTLLALLTLSVLFRSVPAAVDGARWLPRGSGLDPMTRTVLLPQHGRSAADESLPLVALCLVAALAVTLLVFARFRPGFVLVPALHGIRSKVRKGGPTASQRHAYERSRERRMRWSHSVVAERLPTILLAGLLVYVFVVEVLAFPFIGYLMDEAYEAESFAMLEFRGTEQVSSVPVTTTGDSAVGVGVTVAVALGLWVLRRGASGPLNDVLASVGDVAGFWPIAVNPFGGRSYRKQVTQELNVTLSKLGRDKVVLVGHSQGSVLAAWCAANPDPTSRRGRRTSTSQTPRLRGLVTCGTPLMSLYARFFPSCFSAGFFDDVASGTRVWHNYWRKTDPIATELGLPCIDHLRPDAVARPGDQARGHSDYWIDADQVGVAEEIILQDEPADTPEPDGSRVSTSPPMRFNGMTVMCTCAETEAARA